VRARRTPNRIKIKLADALHDKVLHADAQMNKADWMTACAAMVGVVGVGFGVWWLDAVAAIAIGTDIFHDGAKYTSAAMRDLLDGRPRRYDETGEHPGQRRDTDDRGRGGLDRRGGRADARCGTWTGRCRTSWSRSSASSRARPRK
jgi:hypothetical protein